MGNRDNMKNLITGAILLSTLILSLLPSTNYAQSISFSFDDGWNTEKQPLASTWNDSILRALSDSGIRSIIFPAGKRVNTPAGLNLIKA